jgi:hypothetical protein
VGRLQSRAAIAHEVRGTWVPARELIGRMGRNGVAYLGRVAQIGPNEKCCSFRVQIIFSKNKTRHRAFYDGSRSLLLQKGIWATRPHRCDPTPPPPRFLENNARQRVKEVAAMAQSPWQFAAVAKATARQGGEPPLPRGYNTRRTARPPARQVTTAGRGRAVPT